MAEPTLLAFNVLIVGPLGELADIINVSQIVAIKVRSAATGHDAIHHISRRRPHLMILDPHLPDMDGWRVVDFTKQKYGEYGVQTVIASRALDRMTRTVGQLHHVSHFLTAPFQSSEVMGVIDAAIRDWERQHAW